jgi:hypothetical protein
VIGVLIDEDRRVQQLLVARGGTARQVPFDVVVRQSRRWVCVDATQHPLASFPTTDVRRG